MKAFKCIGLSLFVLILVVSAIFLIRNMQTDADDGTATNPYINTLMQAGFPESYAALLAKVHEQHPSWTFEPVLITELNEEYTWNYVIKQEMYPRRNLVTTSTWAPAGYLAYYRPYYDTSNITLYDSGWRQASQAAVEYFMDPRNFLNEVDIFMFETLAFNPAIHTKMAVEHALFGTFMSAERSTVDGKNTYASLIFSKAAECNLNPIYVANRILLEQGTEGTSPLVNGTLGTTMWNYYNDPVNRWDPNATNSAGAIIWGGQYDNILYTQEELLQRNGLYNFFNMGASGTGYFAIYMNASTESQSEGWTTKAAALTGGIQKVHDKYIANHQYTPYFQKFNVHPGSSSNFWGQYMQDVSGALSGGRRAYNDYLDTNNIDAAHHFVVPVYGNMPAKPCPDPADGLSYYSPSSAQETPDAT